MKSAWNARVGGGEHSNTSVVHMHDQYTLIALSKKNTTYRKFHTIFALDFNPLTRFLMNMFGGIEEFEK